MAKQDAIKVTGLITEALGNSIFRVELDNVDNTIICHISQNYIKIMPGDKVEVEMSPYDLTKGRIVKRLKIQ